MDIDQEKKDRLKKLTGMRSYSKYIENRLAMDFVYALNDVVDSLQSNLDKTKADLLEMAKMILSDDITEIEISKMELKAQQIIKGIK